MLILVLVLWMLGAFLSVGISGVNYVCARRAAERPWKTKKDSAYLPKVSIVVPTYNEHEVIGYKLRNLAKLEYPRDLLQLVFVDSHSTDSTVDSIRDFIMENPKMNVHLLVESERKGKSSALNAASRHVAGDVIVISDADCFWPAKILFMSLPYLADPSVGAVSGPKSLLNSQDSWVTRSEERYLRSANLIKLGESKTWSTILFEGGFSAYKRGVLETFDPYNTGSDDCGSVIRCLEKNLRAIMVTEGQFFTTFPNDLKGRIEIKIRRGAQLFQVLKSYGRLLLRGTFSSLRWMVTKNLLLYVLAPIMFIFLIAMTAYLIALFPPMIILLAVFLIPKINVYAAEATLNYLIMFYSMISTVSNRTFSIWKKPSDRQLLLEDDLLKKQLI